MKKKPRFGAIPKLNMPKRSHDTVKPTPRPSRSVVLQRIVPVSSRAEKPQEVEI